MVNQLRYSFQQTKLYFQGGSYPNCTATNREVARPRSTFGNHDDSPPGVHLVFPQGRTVKVTQVQGQRDLDAAATTPCSLAVSTAIRNSPNVGLFYYNGQLNYQNLSDFIQNGSSGDAYGIFANGNPVIPFTENDYALYLQGRLESLSHLTAHIGTRWEYFGQAVNRLHSENRRARKQSRHRDLVYRASSLRPELRPRYRTSIRASSQRLGFAWNSNVR